MSLLSDWFSESEIFVQGRNADRNILGPSAGPIDSNFYSQVQARSKTGFLDGLAQRKLMFDIYHSHAGRQMQRIYSITDHR